MHPNAFAILALDIATERVREADEARLARLARPAGPSIARRFVARGAAALGLALAQVAIRLDGAAADPIRRRLVADRVERIDPEQGALA